MALLSTERALDRRRREDARERGRRMGEFGVNCGALGSAGDAEAGR